MNGINYTSALNNTIQLSQTSVLSRLTPLLKAIAVITAAFIAIGAVYFALTHGINRRPTQSPTTVHPQLEKLTPQTETPTLQTETPTLQTETPTLQTKIVNPQHETVSDISTIALRWSTENEVQIYISGLHGEFFGIGIPLDRTVLEMKRELHAMGGPPIDSQEFVFQGQCLEDHRTLNDYFITELSTIVLLPKN